MTPNAFTNRLDDYHRAISAFPWRIISFIGATVFMALVMWDPVAFAESIGGFNVIRGIGLIWAVCIGMIHAVGFFPQRWYWQLIFSPFIAWPVYLCFTCLYFL
ncbi:hypothetical protein VST7929_00850 [Vibrio stylophorae]|uniref:Cyd operon protein YbgE n=1 Tax=Vibrio stylophorae TaxID=659351 RepID=A0ABM8ZRR4_9VIBR|nr:cyd operon YbgE family protein [Vibrio stylophorae]CAH0532999.1 hypothetical protein VST7929_00850 [Vibrio stylophorae]